MNASVVRNRCRRYFCSPRAASLCVFLSAMGPCLPAIAQAPAVNSERPWRVVLLNNADFFLPASTVMDQTLRQTLINESPRQIDFYGETLDLLRYPRETEPELVALMRKKFSGKHVDLVLARAQGGFEFAERHRDELWPGVPIVFYDTVGDTLRNRELPPNATGLLIDLDPAGTIQLTRRLHPGALHLYVVGGTAEYDRAWKRRVESILSQSSNRVPVTWLDDVPLPRILDQLSHLPPSSVVLYTSMVRDASGLPQNNPKVAGLVAQAANAPVYGFLDTYVGQGIVGGAIADFAAQGTAAARLALRVLNGESASVIPIQMSPPARCVIDARAMGRWNIDEGQLPAGCDVRFRAPSLWRDYRWYVLGALLALSLQSALIAALVFQRRRRHRAEIEASHRRSELMQASRLALAGQLTASIAHEINQPLGAILVNTGAAKGFLEDTPPNLDEVRNILADIRKEDLRAGEVIRRVRALLIKGDVERQPTDINALAVDTLALLDPEARRRGIAIETALAPDLPAARVDRVQVQQALLNLCVNAMDAMSETVTGPRQLELATTAGENSGIEIAISDHGPGIRQEEMPRLFDSFFTTKPHGMGLGLSITRSIVEAHGGTLTAENRADGGAIFRIVLPIGDAERPYAGDRSEGIDDRSAV